MDAVAPMATLCSGWKRVPLGDIATIVNGGTPKSKVVEFWNGDIQWLTPKDMGQMEAREISATSRTISEAGLTKSSARLVPPHSVILSTRAPIGHLAINTVPMAFNQGCRGIVHGDRLDNVFLYYFLVANRRMLDALGSGTTFKELSAPNLRAVEIPLPPLEEQKRIVAVLDQAFAALDRARANVEANLADAQAIFDSWLNAAFEFGAENWPATTLPEISENLDRSRVPITKKDREPGDIPYYGASGIVDYVADYIFDEDLLLISEDGANLLARTYPIAYSISGKSWVNNHAHALRFADMDSQEFVRLYLNSISLDPWVTGMAQPKLNQKALNRIPVPYPDASDRKRIVAEAAEIWRDAESARINYQAHSEDLSCLRQSLLQQAFSGQLT